MAPRKKNPPPEPEQNTEAFVERQTPETLSSTPSRLTLPLDGEGSIDWERAKDSQKELFTAAVLNSPDALEAIGLAAGGADGVQQEGWSKESVHFALDLLSTVNGFCFRFASQKIIGMKVDGDISTKAFEFHRDKDNPEEDDYEKLTPPMQRMADRFIHVDPKYQDAILFFTALTSIITRQAQEALLQQAIRDEAKKNQQPPQPTRMVASPKTPQPQAGASA